MINEHIEPALNARMAMQLVSQRFPKTKIKTLMIRSFSMKSEHHPDLGVSLPNEVTSYAGVMIKAQQILPETRLTEFI